jgi:hypothetical protein
MVAFFRRLSKHRDGRVRQRDDLRLTLLGLIAFEPNLMRFQVYLIPCDFSSFAQSA